MDSKLKLLSKMNKLTYVILIVFFAASFKSQAQGVFSKKHFEIGAYYPVIIGDKLENRFNGIYNGIIGVDFKYTVKKLPFINLKVGSTFDFLKFDKDSYIKGSSIRLNPNIMIGVDLSKIIRLEPYIGVGYSFVFDNGTVKGSSWDNTWNTTVNDPVFNLNEDDYSDSTQNVFYKIGINYKLNKLLYIDTHLYMANVFNKSEIDEFNNSNLKQSILNIGVGIQF